MIKSMDDQSSPDMDWPNGDGDGNPPAPTSGTQNGTVPFYDPACDQCRMRKVRCNREQPKCSNCRKAKVACGFSNKGKRVNHTTKLVNNVDVLGKRMDKIEAAILKCVNAVEQHITVTTTSLQSTKGRSSDEESDALDPLRPQSAQTNGGESPIRNSEDLLLPLEQRSQQLFTERGGYERSFGSGSVYSIWVEIICTTEGLFARSQSFVTRTGSSEAQNPQSPQKSPNSAIIAALDPCLQSTLQKACEHLQKYCADPSLEECSDGSPLSLPPRFLLETILDPFLRELNPILPIFARSSLLEAIKVQYDPQQHRLDPAWATCFNNLILQILTTKAGGSAESLLRNSMDDTLRTTFLINAQRCYSNLGALLKPRVVNVQALLSMALVALKYFRYPVFETLFALACQVAKAVGLHQRVDSASNRDTSEEERVNLFWTLFVMDKQLALMCGKSCHLHGFDCDVPLPPSENTSDMPLCDHWIAAIKLAFLNEEIYRSLYSAESTRASDAQRQRKVEALTKKLNSWATAHQQLLSDDETWSSQKSSSSLELRYSMLTSQILVLRRSKNRESKAQLLTNARACLNIIRSLCQDTIASNVALERILLHYPLVSFVDLYKSIIEEVSMAPPEDIQLLAFVTERISNQAATPSQLPYMSKLKTVTALCCGVCMSIKGAKDLGTATVPVLSAFSPSDQSPSGLDHYSRFSDPFFLSPSPGPKLSMPPDDFLWDTDYQTLSGNKHILHGMVPASGEVDYSPEFQLQHLANAPPVTNPSPSNSHENICHTSPLYPFQRGVSASQVTYDPPQAVLPKDWPPTDMSDQMDFTSYIENFGVT